MPNLSPATGKAKEMGRKKQTKGKCGYCGREMTRSGMTRHLADCPKRQEVIAAANETSGVTQTLYHLVVKDAWGGSFWLHLEMNGSATLKQLDRYLRAIWLECCGHLSRFSPGGWGAEEIAMSRKADQVFDPGLELTHIYDFGTSSRTLVQVAAMRQGKPTTTHPIALMARNDLEEEYCMECERPATWLCMTCIQELDLSGLLCDVHVKDHPHDEYGEPMPIFNSPRTGMCGYEGPAEPPY